MKDVTQTAQNALYDSWRKAFFEEDISRIAHTGELGRDFLVNTSTSVSHDPKQQERLSDLANRWETITNALIPHPRKSNRLATLQKKPRTYVFQPELDQEVTTYGLENSILPDIVVYYRHLCAVFNNVTEIAIALVEDYESLAGNRSAEYPGQNLVHSEDSDNQVGSFKQKTLFHGLRIPFFSDGTVKAQLGAAFFAASDSMLDRRVKISTKSSAYNLPAGKSRLFCVLYGFRINF